MPQLYAAEAVLPGHPDKLCDAIADALVEEATRRQRRALVDLAVAVHRSAVFVTGRLACQDAASIDVPGVVRSVYAGAGYSTEWGPAPETLRIECDLCVGPLNEGEAELRAVSDDQSLVVGYAVDQPGSNYLPAEHWLAQSLMRRLEKLRSEQPALRLGPDGKLIVLLEEDRFPTRLAGFSASLQQARDGPQGPLQRAVLKILGEELHELARGVPGFESAVPESVQINGASNRMVGGPEADNGQSGKQVVIDAYGPRVAVGGAALSGKDLFQADRAGAILARRLARAAVLTGAAHEVCATLVFVPGQEQGQIVSLVGDGKLLDASRWAALLDRSLAGVGERYTGKVSLIEAAQYGHFTNPAYPWEVVHFDGGGSSSTG